MVSPRLSLSYGESLVAVIRSLTSIPLKMQIGFLKQGPGVRKTHGLAFAGPLNSVGWGQGCMMMGVSPPPTPIFVSSSVKMRLQTDFQVSSGH